MIIITIIFWVILIVLLANALYFVVFSLSGLGYQPKFNTHTNTLRRFTVIFPAYKEDAVILPAVQSALNQQYDSQQLSVWVLADAFQPETCESLRNMGANVIEIPDFSDRNKSKALNYALPLIPDSGEEICVIMDGDNQVAPDFLQRLNLYFQGNTQAVQARRVALNENTDYAVLDSLSESINNHIFRKGQVVLGFSASLIGSGMAFDRALFTNIMREIHVFSGFDKELELRLLERKIHIEYAADICVKDEKVQKHEVFVNQRRRWLFAQWQHLIHNSGKALQLGLGKGNFDYLNKVIQFALLPRVMGIGLGFFWACLGLLFFEGYAKGLSIAMFLAMMLAMLLPVMGAFRSLQTYKALLKLPFAFIGMLFALITSKRAAKKFIHTPHGVQP